MKKKQHLLKYTWPIFIELLLQLLVSNIDKIMVNSISNTAVSSIANATTVLDVLIIAFTVISLAITILGSQYFGKNDHEKITQVYSLGLLITGFVAICSSIALLIFAKDIFMMIKVPLECLNGSVIYLKIMAIGLLFQGLYNGYVAIYRTQGWMKQTMLISFLVNLVNTVGNFLLIYGIGPLPQLNVAGAAISSVISRITGLIIMIYFFNKHSEVKIDFKTLKPWPKDLFKTMLHIGLPSGGESLSYSASQMVILGFVNTFGNAVVKLRSFANMFQMCSYMFGAAISQAAQIIVGYLMGQKDIKNAKIEVNKTLIVSCLISFVASFILYLASDQVFGLFIKDSAMLKIAKDIMFVEIFLEVARAVNMTLVRSLQACGDTVYPMILGIISMWGVATFLSYFLGIVCNLGLLGVWISMCLDESIRAILFLIRWYKGNWQKKLLID